MGRMATPVKYLGEIDEHIDNIHRLLLLLVEGSPEQRQAVYDAQEKLTAWQEVELHNIRGAIG